MPVLPETVAFCLCKAVHVGVGDIAIHDTSHDSLVFVYKAAKL